MVTAPKFNIAPKKRWDWKTSFLLGPGPFSGAMLSFRSVIVGLGPGGLGFESGYL